LNKTHSKIFIIVLLVLLSGSELVPENYFIVVINLMIMKVNCDSFGGRGLITDYE